jgi:hypothetical protein
VAVTVAAPRWDWPAIRAGAGVALVFAVPLAIGARIAADRDDDALAVGLSIGATIGFLIGAGCAAWVQRVGFPLSHALVTAGGTYIAAQTVFIAVRLVRGEDVRWFGALFTLTFVMFAGLLGGLLGQRLRSAGVQPSRSVVRKGP